MFVPDKLLQPNLMFEAMGSELTLELGTVIYKAIVFVNDKSFQPNLIFVGKAKSLA